MIHVMIRTVVIYRFLFLSLSTRGSWEFLQSLANVNSVCVLFLLALASNLYTVSVGSFCLSYCLSFLFVSHDFYSVESTDDLRLCTPFHNDG